MLLLRQQSMLRPVELAVLDVQTQALTTITDVNGKLFENLVNRTREDRQKPAADATEIGV